MIVVLACLSRRGRGELILSQKAGPEPISDVKTGVTASDYVRSLELFPEVIQGELDRDGLSSCSAAALRTAGRFREPSAGE
jgi:hypothetical protein